MRSPITAPLVVSDDLHAADDMSVEPMSATPMSWIQRRLSDAIIFYQRGREGRLSPCRFFPSCSAYALEALEVHGTLRGVALTVRRLLRCRPLGPSGVDLVPLPAHARRDAPAPDDHSCADHSPLPKAG